MDGAHFNSPAQHLTTCRRGQMSKWRQRGFVQDSDEDEEESQIESQSSKQDVRRERRVGPVLELSDALITDKDVVAEAQKNSDRAPVALNEPPRGLERRLGDCTPQRYTSPRGPTLSPFTPLARPRLRERHLESPDPLQSSPSANSRFRRPPTSSQPHQNSSHQPSSEEEIELRAHALPSQILGDTTQGIHELPRDGGLGAVNASTVLGEFGVATLSDNSEDELNLRQESDEESNLSDYPSDLSETELRSPTAYATPHRRTAVQVVIPSSNTLRHQLAVDEARQRNFRERKPIQLHPYMLEGELYRREVQSRGLKPVLRARSPLRKQNQGNAESQEGDFNPFRNNSSSPPDPEIFVSTPVARQTSDDVLRHSSTKRPNSRRRGSPAVQLRVPKPMKRRKLNQALVQTLATPERTCESSPIPLDIWRIPAASPPYSSSPPRKHSGNVASTRNTDSLPTPSNSSSVNDGFQAVRDSDSEPVPRSAQRSAGELRRSVRVVLSDEAPSDSDTASSASEQEEGELQKVSKRIRGVLPASWLRIDRQAQQRRQAMARRRAQQDVTQSLDPAEPQRGVAQKITKTSGRSAGYARPEALLEGVVIISDGSDQELEPSTHRQSTDLQRTVESASALAAMFDDRYIDSGDDLANMEHDRLHLHTLGGLETKQKRQPKTTEAFGNTGRTRFSTSTGVSRSSRPIKITPGASMRRKQADYRRIRTNLPILSVLDVELPPEVPQFLKLARRAARRDIDQARQSPRRKQIRLHTAQDTDDANATLRQWQQGLLKPRITPTTGQDWSNGPPLADTTKDRQHGPQSGDINRVGYDNATIKSVTAPLKTVPQRLKTLDHTLRILRKSSNFTNNLTRSCKMTVVPKTSKSIAPHMLAPVRTAQLEGDEKTFGWRDRKIAFQKGLQRVDQQPGNSQGPKQHSLNPQLARFLADDGAVLPPQSAASDVGELQDDSFEGMNTANTIPKRRPRQKPQANRLDADAREYRQPTEPAFKLISAAPDPVATEYHSTQDEGVLFGLGPFGTQYPITFDVTPLKSDTYFHLETFVGSEDLRRALAVGARDLDEPAGYCVISHGLTTVRCGPWSDETYSQIAEMLATILPPFEDSRGNWSNKTSLIDVLASLSTFLRALAAYFSEHLSFSDAVDRRDFTTKMRICLQTLFERVSTISDWPRHDQAPSKQTQGVGRVLTYLLVIGTQVYHIARQIHAIEPDAAMLLDINRAISSFVVKDITKGTKAIYDFHEKNKHHKERENGIRNCDVLIENIVVCMHALELLNAPSLGFWDLVSKELSLSIASVNQLQAFDNVWATTFSLLPFTEFDLSGIPDRTRLKTFDKTNWGCICTLLKRLLDLYVGTSQQSASSMNEYVRANFTRCYVLINDWHWKRPEHILNVIFDFFGKHGLKPLRNETATSSAGFLQNFAATGSLKLVPKESAFHIALKCLATGLQSMVPAHPEKKLRSFVFRRIPNHGRTCPKDQALEEESLAALRNHHDLLSTLYCGVPPACRPKLDRIRDLVSHETSHREACRVSVRAWANLSTFQLSTDEPYAAAKPFALWYKDIMHQTLKQYRLAKTEADDYLKSGVFDESTKVVAVMVKQTMQRNQEQVIATLRDSIAGMKQVVRCARDQNSLIRFLADSDIVHLLELPHLEDRRLISVIRETLSVIQQYAAMRKPQTQHQSSQPRSEESQDYGDFPDLDDLGDLDDVQSLQSGQSAAVPQPFPLDFIQGSLWHLMSNAFGAEHAPDDNLLLECIDTWVSIAGLAVTSGGKDWSHYINSFSQVSWQQLRPTEQTRRFGPYFMAALIAHDSAAYKEHRQDVLTALLLCLADRESMLRFQHRLLSVIIKADEDDPLLRNLPFFKTEETGGWDITADSLRSRRLSLISSLLANMREDVYTTSVQEPSRTLHVKATYAAMLMHFMTRLKNNYQQLQQGARVAGAYVEFVQKIVQFLKQFTSDICPVSSFFTDSVAFPLPTIDPAYVVGRLCGYAPKVQDSRTAKELLAFVETITQQSAIDNQQISLVNQLTRALCTEEAPVADRVALRTMFLQGIFPAYIERAFMSRVGFLTARPILQCLSTVLDDMVFDLRVNQIESVSTAVGNIVSIAHAFIRSTEQLKGDAQLLQMPHNLSGLVHMFEVAVSISRLLDYVVDRTLRIAGHRRLSLITYLDAFSIYIAQMLEGTAPLNVPSYSGNADASSLNTKYPDILSFCARSLQSNIEMNWAEDHRSIWFGQGRARREVIYDIGSTAGERERLLCVLQKFRKTLDELYGDHLIGDDVQDDIIV
ncbi:Mus7/MMS22 family protein [Stagonosporopsis vannaccii]|nr:Mus7/MMS22 family protein [Stagonosporopsis vannaccii]